MQHVCMESPRISQFRMYGFVTRRLQFRLLSIHIGFFPDSESGWEFEATNSAVSISPRDRTSGQVMSLFLSMSFAKDHRVAKYRHSNNVCQ